MLQKTAKGALLLFFRWKSIVTGPQLHSSRNQTIWSTAFFKWKRKHCKLSFSKLFVAEHLETHSAPGYSSHSMSLASSFHICQFGIIWLSMVSVTYGKPRNCVLCVESNFLVKMIWQLSWICKIEYFALWKCGFLTHREHKLSTSVTLEFNQSSTQIQGGFFNWSALKMTKCQITCKSLQKSSKCQNFLRVWHLVIFRADQWKKPPCIFLIRGVFVILISDIVLDKSACQRLQDMINRTRRIVEKSLPITLLTATAL